MKIRDTINGTLEEQLNRKAEKTRRIEDDKAAITARRDAAGVKLRAASPAFGKMQDDLVAARAQAAAAHKASDSVAMMTAQTTADKLQDQINQQEDAAIGTDPEVIAKQKEIKDTQAEMRPLDIAIANATKARDQLLDGMRVELKIPGPPAVGNRGLLGRVKPTKIIDANSFTMDYQALEMVGENKTAKAADGFKTMNVKPHNIKLIVTGVDTSKLHVGTEALMDHNFAITATQPLGKVTAYVVTPSETELRDQELDHLFDLLDVLRVNN